MVLQNQIKNRKKIGLHTPNKVIETSRVKVNSYSFLNINELVVIKSTKGKVDITEFIHELFIGIICVNQIRMEIPNFMYTFGTYTGKLMLENISGITIQNWITKHFRFGEYIRLLYQICLSLETARTNCDFYHNDLTPWNIMLKHLNRPEIIYNITDKTSISIHNIKIVPIIIDYGKSSGVYKNTNYFLNKSSCDIQDILSFLVTSLNLIVTKIKIPVEQYKRFFLLSNFLEGKYMSKYISSSKITNMSDLKKFTDRAKKYDEIIFGEKSCINKKRLYHFRDYLQTYFSDELKPLVLKHNDYIHFRGKYNTKHVFDHIYANNNNERYNSFKNIFYNFKSCTLPHSKNRFTQCMISLNFGNNLTRLFNNYTLFQKYGKKFDNKIKELYDNCMYWIRTIYLGNKGIYIGFFGNNLTNEICFNIMNVLYSKQSYLYKDDFYTQILSDKVSNRFLSI